MIVRWTGGEPSHRWPGVGQHMGSCRACRLRHLHLVANVLTAVHDACSGCMTARRCANVLAGGAQSGRLACDAGRGGLSVSWFDASLGCRMLVIFLCLGQANGDLDFFLV